MLLVFVLYLEDAPLFQIEDIHRIISAEVLKREVLEGPQAQDAIKKLAKLSRERKKQEPPAGSAQQS